MNQMGKFYELYEMDAHVGAKELNLQYMKVLDSVKDNIDNTFSIYKI